MSAAVDGARFHDLVGEMRDLTQHSTHVIGLLQELEHAVLSLLADSEKARIREGRGQAPSLMAV